MADTQLFAFEELCSDCGERTASFRHTGRCVPKGTVGYFCIFCWNQREAAADRGELPKPLGVKPPGEPEEFKHTSMKATTKSGTIYEFSAPDKRGERIISCNRDNIGFKKCKVLLLVVGKEMWLWPTEIPGLWATTKVTSIT